MKNIVNPLNINAVIEKLKSPSLELSELIGVLCCIIHSKEIFKHNKDIVPFLGQVFNISYLQYILNSRTLISARLTKHVLNVDEKELNEIQNKLIKYIQKSKSEVLHTGKKKNANDKLNIWLKGL